MAALILPIGAVGSAQERETAERCSPLYRNIAERQAGAGLSAHIYSQEHVGAVGISIYPGRTLSRDSAHSLGVQLVNAFRQNDVEASCFVHFQNGSGGSGFDFVISGLSWNEEGPLNITEATNVETLRSVIAEAKTARTLLSSN